MRADDAGRMEGRIENCAQKEISILINSVSIINMKLSYSL